MLQTTSQNVIQCSDNAVKPHHASEKMPVSKVHIHLFLQLVNTALSQYPAIYVCLSENKNKIKNVLNSWGFQVCFSEAALKVAIILHAIQ